MTVVQRILSSYSAPGDVKGLLKSLDRWKRGQNLGLGNTAMKEGIRYLESYRIRDVNERKFFNFGGGSFWHPAWQNVEL